MKRVLVIGANGNTGMRVVKLLKASSSYTPVAMIRNVEKADELPMAPMTAELLQKTIFDKV